MKRHVLLSMFAANLSCLFISNHAFSTEWEIGIIEDECPDARKMYKSPGERNRRMFKKHSKSKVQHKKNQTDAESFTVENETYELITDGDEDVETEENDQHKKEEKPKLERKYSRTLTERPQHPDSPHTRPNCNYK